MAHNLDFSLGRAAIAVVEGNPTPWHGYVNWVPREFAGDIDVIQEAAGLNWHVEEKPVAIMHADPFEIELNEDTGQITVTWEKGGMATFETQMDLDLYMAHHNRPPEVIKNKKGLVRSDTGYCLGLVSDRFKTVQPREALEFYARLIKDFGFEFRTAGSLKNGQRIWAMARATGEVKLHNQDLVENNLLFTTGFDATLSSHILPTSISVVCENTLNFSLFANESKTLTVPHSQTIDFDQLHEQLGLLPAAWEQFRHLIGEMSCTFVSLENSIQFFTKILGPDAFTYDKERNEMVYSQKFGAIMDCYHNGRGANLPSRHRTLWGIVNAVTEYADHEAKARSADNRLNNAWFGHTAQLKNRAYAEAVEYLGKAA